MKEFDHPVFTAIIEENKVLSGFEFFFDRDKTFKSYFYLSQPDKYGNILAQGKLESPRMNLVPNLFVSSKSIYGKGANEGIINQYVFNIGTYVHMENKKQVTEIYKARLLIPVNLSNAFLQSFRIRNPQEISNAVLIMDPPMQSSQWGANYVRMFCRSE